MVVSTENNQASTEANVEAPRRSGRSTSRPSTYSLKMKRAVKDAADSAIETAEEVKEAVTQVATDAAAAVAPAVEAVTETVQEAVAPVAKKVKTSAQLSVGDKLPAVTLKDDKDKEVDISSLKKVVFFVYPKADTPGCTTQACNFRDSNKDFADLGYTIYGLSADTVAAQSKWEQKNNFNYSLLSDKSKLLLGPLGVVSGTSLKRSHVIVDADGNIALLSIGVKPADSTKDALSKVKELAESK